MLPAEQGRFCQSCNKQVIDFTQMSDNEILQLLSKPSAGTCGRFTQNQLDKPLTTPPIIQPLKPSLRLFLTAFVAVFLLVNEGTAQAPMIKGKVAVHSQPKTPRLIGDTVLSPIPTTQISGTVQDTSGQPIAGASIFIKGTKTGTATDENGYFTIRIPKQAYNFLQFSSVGFSSKEILVKSDTTKQLSVQLESNSGLLMGDVIVVGRTRTSKKPKKVKWLQQQPQKCEKPDTDIAANQHKNSQLFSFFPNPAKAGSDIKIIFKKEGKYNLQLMDISGRILAAQQMDIADKNLTATMHLPDELNNGTYLLNMVKNGSNKVQTEKIMVQQ